MRCLKRIAVIWILAVGVLYPAGLQADGRYRILMDDGGVFLQTENDGGWYIPEEDLQFFTPGQSGNYRIGHDGYGRYLETEHGKFYLGSRGQGARNEDVEAFNRSQNEQDPPAVASKVTIAGEHVIVPVRIKHKGRSLELKLLLDTGASIITLHREGVKRLRLSKEKTAHFTTADGHIIAADLVELDEVRFGPYRQEHVLAGVIEHKQRPLVAFDGLLGMNALKGIDYRIDYAKGLIHWVKDNN